MAAPAVETNDELLRVNGCLRGDAEALGLLRENCHGSLVNILVSRGAGAGEAEDLLADLWSDCVPGGDEKPSLLEKFSGRCKLMSWLATVATRRWIDFKRRQNRNVAPPELFEDFDCPEGEEARGRLPGEDGLSDILRRSLQVAFDRCPADMLVLLRLRYLHNLSQRELVRMVGWHESKVSRVLSRAMQQIEDDTLAEMKRLDPWLQLTWDDFLDLCNSMDSDFL